MDQGLELGRKNSIFSAYLELTCWEDSAQAVARPRSSSGLLPPLMVGDGADQALEFMLSWLILHNWGCPLQRPGPRTLLLSQLQGLR